MLQASIMVEEVDNLQSVGYKNIAISDKHVNSGGDVMFSVRLSIIHKEEESHSLSSDLSSLINDQKSADCILQAGDRTWQVHSNILAARSPVFAKQLSELDENSINRKISTTSESSVSLVQANITDNIVPRVIISALEYFLWLLFDMILTRATCVDDKTCKLKEHYPCP